MPFQRAEAWFPTLRSRLTFWNTAVLLLVVTLTLIGLRQALMWTMLRELDHLLGEDAQEVELLIRSKPTDDGLIREALERKARSHREDGWFVEIFHLDGTLYFTTQPSVTPLPLEEPVWGITRKGRRTVSVRIAPENRSPLVVRVGASLDGIDEDVGRLTKLLIVIGILIVGIAPLAGWFLAGRATRPLAAILRTTGRLRPDHLGERLQLRGTNDELDRLSKTINQFLDRLARHLEQQRDFVANAAHELRSPLTALMTAIEITLQRERSGEEYRELLDDLAQECDSLRTLVNQLLLLAESDAGVLRPGDTLLSLDDLVRRSVEMFQGVAEHKEIDLRADRLANVTVKGHAIHLRQVIHNLLDNAIKFTPPGGQVTVELRQTENAPNVAELLIRDTGSGISPEDLPHVFDRFARGDRARQRGEGTGLGLCICQSIVKAYGGEIHIESVAGQGTSVLVSLPITSGVLSKL